MASVMIRGGRRRRTWSIVSGKIVAPWDVVLVLLYSIYTSGKYISEDKKDHRN
jgi:hypothetical protein